MPSNLFSTYRAGENRVTASILAVLQSLALHRIERLIGALLEESEFELVRFALQPAAGGEGVPDAEIRASFRLLLETKIKQDAVREDQLQRHLKRLTSSRELNALLVLTPDASQPEAIEQVGDDRLAWSSFATLDQAIDEILSDGTEVVSEREAFLLRELQAMLTAEGLVGSELDTVVVPASKAWDMYHATQAYICQPNRAFRPVERIAFYRKNKIEQLIPRIERVHPEVVIDPDAHEGRMAQIVQAYLERRPEAEGGTREIFELSAPDDPETLRLDEPIDNGLKSKSGRRAAFVQKQRYVASERLRGAKTTTELIDGAM